MCPLRVLRASVVRNAPKTISPLRHGEHRDRCGNQTRTLPKKVVGTILIKAGIIIASLHSSNRRPSDGGDWVWWLPVLNPFGIESAELKLTRLDFLSRGFAWYLNC